MLLCYIHVQHTACVQVYAWRRYSMKLIRSDWCTMTPWHSAFTATLPVRIPSHWLRLSTYMYMYVSHCRRDPLHQPVQGTVEPTARWHSRSPGLWADRGWVPRHGWQRIVCTRIPRYTISDQRWAFVKLLSNVADLSCLITWFDFVWI